MLRSPVFPFVGRHLAQCRRRALRAACLALALGARALCAQEPGRLGQDELDLQGRSSVVQGSGARAFGMGGAFLARPDDATAASWNPAGLSYLRRPELSLVWLGTSKLRTREYDLEGSLTVDDDREGRVFDFVAGTYPVSLGGTSGAVQLSFQRVVAFDSERVIERAGSVMIHSDGGFDVLAFATGLQVSRKWRVGATLNRWFNGYQQKLERRTAINSSQSLRFELDGWNVNLGAIWTPLEELNVGLVAKSPFTARVSMARTREDLVAEFSELVGNSYAADDVRLHLPGAVGVGVSWRPRSTLTLSADYTRSLWSEAYVANFFTLAACQPGLVCPPARQPSATGDLFVQLLYPSLDERQGDTQELRLGLERVLIFERAKLPLRAGLFVDRQYFLRPDGSAPRSFGFTAGVGLVVGPLLLDAAYVREDLEYDRGALDQKDARRVSSVSERAYFSLILRVP